MLKMLLAFTCLTLSIGIHAAPVTWTFQDVVYADNSTTVGSFTYDADLDGGAGVYTSLDFVTTCASPVCSGTVDPWSISLSTPLNLVVFGDDEAFESIGASFAWASPLTNEGGTYFLDLNKSYITDGDSFFDVSTGSITTVPNVPIPAAAWLFGSALLGLGALKRKKTSV
jgi:hypothetical protein